MSRARSRRRRADRLTPPRWLVADCSGDCPPPGAAQPPPAGHLAKPLPRATNAPLPIAAIGSWRPTAKGPLPSPAGESTNRRPENSRRWSGGNGKISPWQPWYERPLRKRRAGSRVHTGRTRARSRRDSQPAIQNRQSQNRGHVRHSRPVPTGRQMPPHDFQGGEGAVIFRKRTRPDVPLKSFGSDAVRHHSKGMCQWGVLSEIRPPSEASRLLSHLPGGTPFRWLFPAGRFLDTHLTKRVH